MLSLSQAAPQKGSSNIPLDLTATRKRYEAFRDSYNARVDTFNASLREGSDSSAKLQRLGATYGALFDRIAYWYGNHLLYVLNGNKSPDAAFTLSMKLLAQEKGQSRMSINRQIRRLKQAGVIVQTEQPGKAGRGTKVTSWTLNADLIVLRKGFAEELMEATARRGGNMAEWSFTPSGAAISWQHVTLCDPSYTHEALKPTKDNRASAIAEENSELLCNPTKHQPTKHNPANIEIKQEKTPGRDRRAIDFALAFYLTSLYPGRKFDQNTIEACRKVLHKFFRLNEGREMTHQALTKLENEFAERILMRREYLDRNPQAFQHPNPATWLSPTGQHGSKYFASTKQALISRRERYKKRHGELEKMPFVRYRKALVEYQRAKDTPQSEEVRLRWEKTLSRMHDGDYYLARFRDFVANGGQYATDRFFNRKQA